ncbi:MAG: hypothetical protein QM802_03450 [Agriterribacter sp.]
MYFLLGYSIQDEKKDMRLNGTIYDYNQDTVGKIFDKGQYLDPSNINAPFIVILDEKDSRFKNRIRKDKISIHVIQAGFLFLISPTAQLFFQNSTIDNLQYFDVAIRGNNFEISDYKIVNILDKIDCVDFGASDLKLYSDGRISRILKLVLDESKIPDGKQIFQLGKFSASAIVIHENIKQKIEGAGLTGFSFTEFDKAYKLY